MASSTSAPALARRLWTANAETVSLHAVFATHPYLPLRQGQSIHQSICKQFTPRVCQRSTPVRPRSINQCQSVTCQTANRLICSPNRPVKTINASVFQMRTAPRRILVKQKHVFLEEPSVPQKGTGKNVF